jgi:hypothetical protein
MAKIMYQSGGHSRLGANAAITFDFLYGSRKFSCCMNTRFGGAFSTPGGANRNAHASALVLTRFSHRV